MVPKYRKIYTPTYAGFCFWIIAFKTVFTFTQVSPNQVLT